MNSKQCHFCKNGNKAIDYKDNKTLSKFTSFNQKILPASRSGICAKHQRLLSVAIKRARFLAILPFVPNHK